MPDDEKPAPPLPEPLPLADAPARPLPADQLVPGSPQRQAALRWLLLQEVEKWRQPNFWLPSFALVAFAVMSGRRLEVVTGSERVDFIAVCCPELATMLPADASTWVTAAVIVRGDPVTETRSLHWPQTEEEVAKANHFVILTEMPVADAPAGHAPCGGVHCGGAGEPCFGPLLDNLGSLGLMPLPTACDGNCAVDVCCEWQGKPRTKEIWCEMRDILFNLGQDLAEEEIWLRAFDSMFVPEKAELEAAARHAAAADGEGCDAPARSPVADGEGHDTTVSAPARSEATSGAPRSSGATSGTPASSGWTSGAPASSGVRIGVSAAASPAAGDAEDETKFAVQWALGCSSAAHEMAPLVAEVIPTLDQENQAAWVDRWRKAGAPRPTSEPNSTHGPHRRRQPKRPGDSSGKPAATGAKKTEGRRRNRSFKVRDNNKQQTFSYAYA